jgi:hypothetical protein
MRPPVVRPPGAAHAALFSRLGQPTGLQAPPSYLPEVAANYGTRTSFA